LVFKELSTPRQCEVRKINVAMCFYLVKFGALTTLDQINTNNCTHKLLKHHFINTIRNCNMFQPLEGHLQGV